MSVLIGGKKFEHLARAPDEGSTGYKLFMGEGGVSA